jgi:catechol 2,3-dioxygenase-like lactoylglutathione lyase family enzyme
MPDNDLVSVRYMVDDVEESIDFYTRHFGFDLRHSSLPAFADAVRGRLRLLLAGPESSAGRPMPTGESPGPAAGTASTCSSTTSPLRSSGSARRGSRFATRSSAARAASRS